MALKLNTPTQDKIAKGITIEGDFGDLHISSPSDSEDDDTNTDKAICTKNVDSLAEFPSSLVQTSNTPLYGHVAVANSKNVQLGNNTHFHGPVVIKQIIHNKSGVENVSYTKTEEDTEHEEQNTPATKIGDTIITKKYHIKPWQKVAIVATCAVTIVAVVSTLVLIIQGKNTSENSSYDREAETPNCITVVGELWEFYTLITITIILVFLTILMFNTLLTPHAYDIDEIHGNNTLEPIIPDTSRFVDNSMGRVIPKADDLIIAPNHLRIVSRTDWLAQPPEVDVDSMVKLRMPVPWVIITHTATESCHFQNECVLRVRLIQMFHIESRKWDDIGYNFLVGGDGSAYYGRGWDLQGAHTLGYNKYSIAIAFIGTFNNEPPPEKQLEACKKVIKLGVQLGKISKDYKLFAHRQLSSTLSPGDKLFNILKTWPNFVNDSSNLTALIPPY